MDRIYVCIDLKSFYASVECVRRNLNPLDTNLVVADSERSDKTICLAVTPSLKKYGLSGRSRLFEVKKRIVEINKERLKKTKYYKFISKSYLDSELNGNNNLELDFIIARPNMKLYIDYSAKIYDIYLKYLSKDDIFVYSIDEVFCDITSYLTNSKLTKEEFVTMILKDIYDNTHITATAGIGTNLYLCKIAMDIVAKRMAPNEFGVRMAYLDELSYRKLLWNHTPLSSFWRLGKGYMDKLSKYNINTMGDIARCSIENEDLLYRLFGVNAELLIDHAWGYECVTIKDIKEYKPIHSSISSGQVLHKAYSYENAKIIVKEMTYQLVLELVKKNLITDNISLCISYDISNLDNNLCDEFVVNSYGKLAYKPTCASSTLEYANSSYEIILKEMISLYKRSVNSNLFIKKINISFNNLKQNNIKNTCIYNQLNLFSNNKIYIPKDRLIKENNLNKTVIDLKEKYGKNTILKAINLLDESTLKERNDQIGGHRA